MNEDENTAIIERLVVGMVDHYKDIMVSCTFNMDGSGCVLSFTMGQIKQMMKDCGVYDNVNGLIGKPCQIKGHWGAACEFIRIWKK